MSRKKWLKDRQSGLGGSDIAALVGADPERGPLDLFLEKTGELKPDMDAPDLERGRTLEPIVMRKYAKETGRKLMKLPMLRDPEHPFILGNMDRLAIDKAGRAGVVEAKTMRVGVFLKARTDGLPEKFVTQLQWYLQDGILQAARAYLERAGLEFTFGAYSIFSAEMWQAVNFDIEPDYQLQRMLREAGIAFHHDHILTGRPPSDKGWDVPVALVKAQTSVIDLDTPELRAAVRFYEETRQLEAAAKDLRGQARQQVIDALRQGTPVPEDGGLMDPPRGAFRCAGAIAHIGQQDGRVTFNKKLLGAVRPVDRQKLFDQLAAIQDTAAGTTEREMVGQIIGKLGSEDIGLDLEQFEKRGKPFDTLRVYVRGQQEEGEHGSD